MALLKAVKKPVIRQAASDGSSTIALRPRYAPKTAPCAAACPAGCDVRGAMRALAEGQSLESARRIFTARNPFAIETPWDLERADALLLHNAGEIIARPENPGAFATILTAAAIKSTLSSDLAGHDAINYGLWYDDA
jgi:hypothetical protein